MIRALLLSSALILGACQAGDAEVKTEIAVAAVEYLSSDALQGRAAGSEGGMKALSYLEEQAMALSVFDSMTRQPFEAVPYPERNPDLEISGTNLIGMINGKTPGQGPMLVITAHFDHLGVRDGKIYNGADDNASGAGALLSIAGSFKDNLPQHDIMIVWLDAEERSLSGAKYLAKTSAAIQTRPILNLNLDMVAQNEAGEIYVAGTYHTPALKPIIEASSRSSQAKLRFGHDRPEQGADDWTGQSDHAVFHRMGVPFIYFGVEDHPHYHQPSDDFETLPLDVYRDNIRLIVATAQALDVSLAELAQTATLKPATPNPTTQ